MENTYQSEAILLQRVPQPNGEVLLLLYTLQGGLLKAFLPAHAQLLPLSLLAVEYIDRLGDFIQVRAWKALRPPPQAEGESFAQVLLRSQLLGEPAPALYLLLKLFLEQIDRGRAGALLSSFRLKVLRHEGVLNEEALCALCRRPLEDDHARYAGESFCVAHKPREALSFSAEEGEALRFLTRNRSLESLQEITLSSELCDKIAILFDHCYG